MIKQRRRFKQVVSFRERLAIFAQDLRDEACRMPHGREKEEMLRRARRADTASHLDDWVRSPGLQPPR